MGAGRTGAPLTVGSVVILCGEESSRALWPLVLYIVERVYPIKDGHVRSVEVRTKKGIYTRSIQRHLQLEAVTAPPSLSLNPVTPTLPPIPKFHGLLLKALFLFSPVTVV